MLDDKPSDEKPAAATPYPGMLGDGTEEQNLGQPGNPAARITAGEVEDAFGAESKPDEKPKG